MEKSADRISYSFGYKLNMGNYESADFHINLSSDVKDGESLEEATKRVQEYVEGEAEKKLNELGRTVVGKA